MQIAIMGAGAIGGFYGALLVSAGHDVVFIARGANCEVLRERGLILRQDGGETHLNPVQVTDDPSQVGPVELVLLTTKAYDLEDAARSMRPLVGSGTVVLSLLNGVDVAERVGAVLGMEAMLAGSTYVPANRPEPGMVHQPGRQERLVFGEPRGGMSERVKRIAQLLRDAGINAHAAHDVRIELWQKFLLLTANAGVSAVTRQPMGKMLDNPETRALYEGCVRETESLARAGGIALAPDAVAQTMAHADSTPPANKPSMLQDLEAGRPLELDVVAATVVRLGECWGVPTPINRMIYAALKPFAAGTRSSTPSGAFITSA